MKSLIQLGILVVIGVVIALAHPFQLVMPWQSGSPAPLDTAMLQIMADDRYQFVESDWGRTTPFNYIAVNGVYAATGHPATTCTDLRRSLDAWGTVSEINRDDDGCEIRARGPGPTTASIELTVDAATRRQLHIEIRVQHTS